MSARAGALEAVDRILNRGGDDMLAEVVAVLHERVFAWVAAVRADGSVAAAAGEAPPDPRYRVPVAHGGRPVGELLAEPREPAADDAPLLERVALLVPHLY